MRVKGWTEKEGALWVLKVIKGRLWACSELQRKLLKKIWNTTPESRCNGWIWSRERGPQCLEYGNPCSIQFSEGRILLWEFVDSTSYQQRHHVAGRSNGNKIIRWNPAFPLQLGEVGTPVRRIGLSFFFFRGGCGFPFNVGISDSTRDYCVYNSPRWSSYVNRMYLKNILH